MYEFHSDKQRYFNITNWVTTQYVIPFLGITDYNGLKVCEVGCGEGGVLKAFVDLGAQGVGIELMPERAELAEDFLREDIKLGKAKIITKNVYDVNPATDKELRFDLIVLKDVIEHIPNQALFIQKLHDLLLPGGKVFFGYPPWWMPFGGHQQICKSGILKRFPWVHLLPSSIYKLVLSGLGESEATIKELLELQETGINTDRMHKLIDEAGFKILNQKYWVTNPIYVKKFNINPIVSRLNIPYLRNFYCTAHYVVFTKK
jgi:SAM-dependent methyltransferase